MPIGHIWTEEDDALALQLRASGLSSSQIAREMGIGSHFAVIGRFKRLKDKGEPVPVAAYTLAHPKHGARHNGLNKRPVGIPNTVTPRSSLAAERDLPGLSDIPVIRVGFSDLEPQMCRYPLWGNGRVAPADKFFCGSPAPIDRPYCAGHAVRCYEPSKPNRSTSTAPRRAA